MHWLLVFVGGGLGAMARHGVNRAGLEMLGPGFPWWTMAVNISGSFLIGLLAGLFGAWETGQDIRMFLITGLLGGYTTFSAFSLDALTLWERGAFQQAGVYVLGSVILSLLAAALGLMVTRAV
ncbi:fluoride efflux transporter CrcB [Sphingomonas sp. NSE70-1]|uniref:Fluoride-specific ion channel FluC n=1 Tax=Sphingomonas caseinilyticus TaxID=2908205 RepID=A0ABT0RUK0_9SPHN|nr:fluoride efflux transporter CrcB [Sphingomonas caseinilyticus]MCL6698677.1 fluoride efflux transporter CrcB [Sphingomonas caseinilyticus]